MTEGEYDRIVGCLRDPDMHPLVDDCKDVNITRCLLELLKMGHEHRVSRSNPKRWLGLRAHGRRVLVDARLVTMVSMEREDGEFVCVVSYWQGRDIHRLVCETKDRDLVNAERVFEAIQEALLSLGKGEALCVEVE